MHESTLAKQIVSVVLERAAAEGATRVRAVHGWLAESEALSAESLSFHFSAHARGTPAEGALLALKLTQVQARCLACRDTYAPDHHVLLCPRCGSTHGELLGQTGLSIESLDVE
jgi:hydrogenase nickel incorporation protein HypA/HybF